MKKTIVLVLLMTMLVGGVCSKNITLQGTATNMPSGAKLVLFEAVGSKLVVRDTIAVGHNGKYKVGLTVEHPTLFIIQLTVEKPPQVHVMAMPEDKTLEMNIVYEPTYNFVRVESSKGSKNMELYKKFNDAIYAPLPEYARINAAHTAPNATDAEKKALASEMQSLQLHQRGEIKAAIAKHSDCLMSAFLVTFFDSDYTTYMELYEQVLHSLESKYANSPFVSNIAQKVAASMKEGSLAPEIEMKDRDGKVRRLSDMRGKVVLIDFWASWCGPCRAELPNVVRLYQKYHDKGFDIYSVSLDKDRNAWLQAILNTGQVWENHVSDLNGWTSSGGHAYGVSSIPYTVLIDRKGRVIAKKLRGEELAVKLQEIFGE